MDKNNLCKLSNGIIGITKTDTARDKFCATWGEWAQITNAAWAMFGMEDDDLSLITRKDALPARTPWDEAYVKKLVKQLNLFKVFIMSGNSQSTDDNAYKAELEVHWQSDA